MSKVVYQKEEVLDGASASATVAYYNTQAAYIFPITPSTTASETYEILSVGNQKNIKDEVNVVRQLQSEAGAAGSVHGSLSVGVLTTTFTASQGLLLMIPNMYKIAGELLPCVFHVPARAVAGQALCIFGDHSDVMACRQTGFAMLSSADVQECNDLAQIAHMATLEASVPFIHFYDGFRTSHELQKIKVLTQAGAKALVNYEKIEDFKNRAMHPTNPNLRGTAQQPDVYMQNQELNNRFHDLVPSIVDAAFVKFDALCGRKYNLFDLYGDSNAESVVIMMGAGVSVVREVFEYFEKKNEHKSWALIVPRLYRPWSKSHFLASLPASVKRIAVLDRTKEMGSCGEPLYLDVASSVQHSGKQMKIIGGRYGLGSREFAPPMVLAVFENLEAEESKHPFTIGIVDDVTNLSLNYNDDDIFTVPEETTQCLFYGMGSDGTVGANKNVIKIIGMNTPMKAQGYFAYSAYKAGGLTISHLRFGKEELRCSYLINQATYVAVHRDQYIHELDVCQALGKNGIFVLNCPWDPKDVATGKHLPDTLKMRLGQANAKFYCIDANKVAHEVGMGRRVNSILMTVFFYVSGVLPLEQAIKLFKDAIQKSYGKKGPAVVEANWKAVDAACALTHEIKYPVEEWAKIDCDAIGGVPTSSAAEGSLDHFAQTIVKCAASMNPGLPVSAFQGYEGGMLPSGTTAYEKRSIALNIPIVDMDKCTQCNYCAFVCPHAAIRPFLLDEDEKDHAPTTFDTRKTKGMQEVAGLHYRIQVAPLDCTGCELCSIACPDDALTMLPLLEHKDVENPNWDYGIKVTDRGHLVPGAGRSTLKGSQFHKPLLEFSGACEGCGETPYVKLITQLFGERLFIANATGCSSIWGASYPSAPYTVNNKGYGPAWGNSLFEDAAEYGYGIVVSMIYAREKYHAIITECMKNEEAVKLLSEECKDALEDWLDIWDTNGDTTSLIYDQHLKEIKTLKEKNAIWKDVSNDVKLLIKPSIWIIGGDGWAADIGYGGLDHVIRGGIDVNICVLDTEVYSNTGGQKSKATVMGAQHKFALSGHTQNKKDLSTIFMDYGSVYVASCASSANMAQTVRATVEADRFTGTSLIMCYSPCIEHNYIKPFSSQIAHCKLAVDTGYWLLFRYNPTLKLQGELPLQMDCKKLKKRVGELLERENRYKSLFRTYPETAKKLVADLETWILSRFTRLMFKATYGDDGELLEGGAAASSGEGVVNILYGSETGNAEDTALRLGKNIKARGLGCKVQSFGEIELDELKAMKQVLVFVSTAGQGEIPEAAIPMYQELMAEKDEQSFAEMKFAVMGLGDSSYVYFNSAATMFEEAFSKLGAKKMNYTGMGDDQHEEKFETVLQDWWPETCDLMEFPQVQNVKDTPDEPMYKVDEIPSGKYNKCVHYGSVVIDCIKNERMTPFDYEVEVMHQEYDLGKTGMKYSLGDSLAIWPVNEEALVVEACNYLGFNPEQWIQIKRAGSESNAKLEVLFKKPIQIKQLFIECLDILGKPNRAVYEALYKYCTDPKEKEEAKLILDKSKSDTFKKWTKEETVSIIGLFKKFPSAKMNVAELIDLVPLIKCRYYSIASSQKLVGNEKLELCVGLVDWKDSMGAQRFGQCTHMMSRQGTEGRKGEPLPTADIRVPICGAIKATAFHLPDTELKPVIVAGMGTGIAPFRAFIQHKAHLKRSGKEIGPLVVYFGCRFKAKDYLYAEELAAYKEEGVISELFVAFSRDNPKEKFYIQHNIKNYPDLFHERFHVQGGYFYLCGSATQVPIDMRAAITKVMIDKEGWTFEEADKYITDKIIEGRYNVEAWG